MFTEEQIKELVKLSNEATPDQIVEVPESIKTAEDFLRWIKGYELKDKDDGKIKS